MVLLDHLGHPDISLAVDQLILELGVRVGRYPAVAGVYLLLASPFSSPLALAMN